MRALVALLFVTGCAQGILHSSDAVEEAEANVPVAANTGVDAAREADVLPKPEPEAAAPTTCDATRTDEACFDCCEAMFPKAYDLWDAAYEACCPNDECSDDDSEKCVTAADDLCGKDQECAGLEACEEMNACWEKVSSEP